MIIPVLIETLNSRKTRPNSLIDTIASNYGYRRKLPYANLLTHSLTYSHTPNLEMLSHLKISAHF